jgi:hypothetical protein
MCATLVKSGIFAGEGSFGYTQIDGVINEAANERYTYIKISDLWWDLMGDLIKDVPEVESPNSNPEPTFLPSPLPIGLHMKSLNQGLGVSISMLYPNFSAWSMYQAYLHDDPSLLESNVDLILDKENSELYKIWNEGRGRVVYSYRISRYRNNETGLEGILFETKDGTEIFTPKLKPLKKLADDGKVYNLYLDEEYDKADTEASGIWIRATINSKKCKIYFGGHAPLDYAGVSYSESYRITVTPEK